MVASGVGTSKDTEALTLLLYAQQLASQQGVYWVVRDSESAVGSLRIYHRAGIVVMKYTT